VTAILILVAIGAPLNVITGADTNERQEPAAATTDIILQNVG
jgi:hypothetical protein